MRAHGPRTQADSTLCYERGLLFTKLRLVIAPSMTVQLNYNSVLYLSITRVMVLGGHQYIIAASLQRGKRRRQMSQPALCSRTLHMVSVHEASGSFISLVTVQERHGVMSYPLQYRICLKRTIIEQGCHICPALLVPMVHDMCG